MFVRVKKTKGYRYLQIVESQREGKKVSQRVLATLGQVDELTASGKIDDLTQSMAKFASKLQVIDAHRKGTIQAHRTVSVGPALVFQRLWHQLGIDEVIGTQLSENRRRFSLERAIFLTVLHRLLDPGSDRAADRWKEDFQITGGRGHRASSSVSRHGVVGRTADPTRQRCTKPAQPKGPHRRAAFSP